ncbi:MAG: hypothetical protein E7317_12730, partial [Clostridiales bacterium]|nr:hypothetical protein [Clostridiales bacterium]
QKLALDVLRDLISEALSASIIKGLPQSGDAVFAQSITSACMRPVKAILALGLNDRQAGADDGLLTDAQQKALVDFTKAYLGPDAVDMARIHRFQTKNALCMATDFLLLSNAGSGTDGAAQRPSMLFQSVRALFPKLATAGGVTRDEEIDRIMGMSPKANLHTLAQRVSEGVERLSDQDRLAFVEMGIVSENDPEARQGLDLIEKALDRSSACDSLSPDTARALYGRMEYQSITSLERFANCPFSYYMRYGLSPELVEDYAFDFANEGTFFHACVESFLKESSSDIAGITQEEAERRMDMIADREIAKLMDGPLGDSALSRAEIRRMKATARACGVALREHLMDGRYTPEAMELSFGRPGDATGLVLPGGGRLHGAIDRVDVYHGEEGDFVRIVDYKRGGKKLELYQAYYGLRLQLLCYLDVARRQFNAQPAGVFYFPVKEGIVADQSQSDVVIEMLRTDEMGMDGIAANPGHEGAQSKIRRIERLARHVLERAGEHYRDIRDGSCGIAPSCTGGGHMPCTYCDYRNACMFEQKLDAGRVRTFRKMSNTAILDMFKDQEDEGEGEDSEA